MGLKRYNKGLRGQMCHSVAFARKRGGGSKRAVTTSGSNRLF
jgi:hypothetical protein